MEKLLLIYRKNGKKLQEEDLLDIMKYPAYYEQIMAEDLPRDDPAMDIEKKDGGEENGEQNNALPNDLLNGD